MKIFVFNLNSIILFLYFVVFIFCANDLSLSGHVAHHFFFTKIPHYHLMEATMAIRSVLEPYKAYRCKSNADFLLDYLTLNIKLEYLIGKGTGILTYAVQQKEE